MCGFNETRNKTSHAVFAWSGALAQPIVEYVWVSSLRNRDETTVYNEHNMRRAT